jgi:hypothetical protein
MDIREKIKIPEGLEKRRASEIIWTALSAIAVGVLLVSCSLAFGPRSLGVNAPDPKVLVLN